ncbi:hypothetical protein [Lactococcus lactis]|uniref:hypothetical protein n=1 Tax=Lactococcus lactis TaxID=1358 RepID=UPI000C9EFC57|nr:hypothetical protein [Lactococcus lactis]AUS69949.1 hypothetical protein LLG50_07660 [Lactococcus lactis subsp. lactis]WFR75431.1 hypothetical protein P9166_10545 [Lactococcus lactis]
MKNSSDKITFKKALKDSSLVAGILIILKLLHKLFFNYGSVKEYFHMLFSAKNFILALAISIGILLLMWVLMSLLFSVVYYIYSKIKEKNSKE